MFIKHHAVVATSILAIAWIPLTSTARPIAYADATTFMAEYGRDSRDLSLYYAPRFDRSYGGGWHRYRREAHHGTALEREFHFLRINHLAHRWNLPRAQANAFLWASLGVARGSEFSGRKSAANLGFQLDYETLRVYTMLKSDYWHTSPYSHRMDVAQFGFAPYQHRYGGWATWLVAQLDQSSGALDREQGGAVMLRFFNQTTWIEAGVDNDGKPRANLMINF
ncbi:MAG: hypothetical protein MUE46_06640 [Xanthomonadales bacterium]|jgi:hypothetical protein|nr:hypothetical protein [Xanthomonadales bacterium]